MHKGTPEIVRDLVPMTLWATAENTVGIVVANLPLLRKPFERLFKFLLHTRSTETTTDKTRKEHFSDFKMQSYRNQTARRSRMEANNSRMRSVMGEGDDESDKAILEDTEKENERYELSTGIMKTTEVTVSDNRDRRWKDAQCDP